MDQDATQEDVSSEATAAVDYDELKKQAEIRKIDAEIAALQPKPWLKSEWFWKAVIGGIVSVPLMWFFFQNIVVPIADTKNIHQRWSAAKEREALEMEKRTLANGQIRREVNVEKLKEEKFDLEIEAARVDVWQLALSEIESKLKLSDQENSQLISARGQYEKRILDFELRNSELKTEVKELLANHERKLRETMVLGIQVDLLEQYLALCPTRNLPGSGQFFDRSGSQIQE